jgi:isoamylase
MAYQLTHRTAKVVEAGIGYPLGATPTADGVNFALYSKHASEVFLLLFDAAAAEPSDVIRLRDRTKLVWHAHVRGLRAGQLYAYKVRGDFRPGEGLRFNEHKLLLDPYAKALTGPARNVDGMVLAYDPNAAGRDLSLDTRDNTAAMPKCIVVSDAFDWQGDTSPGVPLESLVIYEVHVKGFTAHPPARVTDAGTYLGFIEKIPHLVRLGVNAVELLPVHEFYVDDFLVARGLTV